MARLHSICSLLPLHRHCSGHYQCLHTGNYQPSAFACYRLTPRLWFAPTQQQGLITASCTCQNTTATATSVGTMMAARLRGVPSPLREKRRVRSTTSQKRVAVCIVRDRNTRWCTSPSCKCMQGTADTGGNCCRVLWDLLIGGDLSNLV